MSTTTRQPAMGLNSNLERIGVEFHVQTEDLVGTSRVRTQVFIHGGRVLHTDHYSYEGKAVAGDLSARLIKVMRACHQKVVRMVEKGQLDEAYRIATGSVAPLVRKNSEVRVREPEAPARGASEVWDSLVREAHRRMGRPRPSKPPIAWDQVIENLRKSG